MSPINQLYTATLELVGRIDEATAEELEELVELREEVLTSLQVSQPTPEQQQLLRELDSYNGIIVARMTKLMNEASEGLGKIARSRVQKSGYETQYAADSYFYDTRE